MKQSMYCFPLCDFFYYYTIVGCVFVTVAISGTLVLFKSI